ncbi:vinculin [Aphelenchoides avenae]|nr:vinculin [Aphelenchus avenae]
MPSEIEDAINNFVFKKSGQQSLREAALEWLSDPRGRPGDIGERSIRRICEWGEKLASRSLPDDQNAIRQGNNDILSALDHLCDLRSRGADNQRLAQGVAQKLRDLVDVKESVGLRSLEHMAPDAYLALVKEGGKSFPVNGSSSNY